MNAFLHQPRAAWSAYVAAAALINDAPREPTMAELKAILQAVSKLAGQMADRPGTHGFESVEANIDLAIELLDDCGDVSAEDLQRWSREDASEARSQ